MKTCLDRGHIESEDIFGKLGHFFEGEQRSENLVWKLKIFSVSKDGFADIFSTVLESQGILEIDIFRKSGNVWKVLESDHILCSFFKGLFGVKICF